MKTAVAENSLRTYRALQAEGYLPPKEAEIFNLFNSQTRLTRQQITEQYGIPINCVTGRVKTLLEKGKLVEDGSVIAETSKKPRAVLRLAAIVPVQGRLC